MNDAPSAALRAAHVPTLDMWSLVRMTAAAPSPITNPSTASATSARRSDGIGLPSHSDLRIATPRRGHPAHRPPRSSRRFGERETGLEPATFGLGSMDQEADLAS